MQGQASAIFFNQDQSGQREMLLKTNNANPFELRLPSHSKAVIRGPRLNIKHEDNGAIEDEAMRHFRQPANSQLLSDFWIVK